MNTIDTYIVFTIMIFLLVLRSYVYSFEKPIGKYKSNVKLKRFYDR